IGELRITGGEDAGKRSALFATHPPAANRRDELLLLARTMGGALRDAELRAAIAPHRPERRKDEVRPGQQPGIAALFGRMLALKVAGAWNKVAPPGSRQPYDVWTQEGIFLDELRFWAAVKPGEALVVPPPVRAQDQKAPRVPTFTPGMSADQLVNLFETIYA